MMNFETYRKMSEQQRKDIDKQLQDIKKLKKESMEAFLTANRTMSYKPNKL